MKNFLLLSILSLLLYSCNQSSPQTGYEINATIANMGNGLAILQVTEPDSLAFTDTVEVKNGIFQFKGEIKEPTQAVLTLTPEGEKQAAGMWFILENSKISIEADYNDVEEYYGQFIIPAPKVTGGPNITLADLEKSLTDSISNQPKYNAYHQARKELDRVQKENPDGYSEALEKYREETAADVEALQNEMNANLIRLAKSHPDVEYSPSLVRMALNNMTLEEMEDVFNSFTPKVQNSYFAQDLREEIAGLRATAPGAIAPDFTLKQLDGSDFTLSSLRGKYVLVDFWASWCVPCRKAVPELKELYKTYKDKGFEIVGVANDTRYDDWKKAIDEDQTPWIHVIDEFPVKNKPAYVSTLYAIHFLPSYFLIDRDGKMIGKMEKEEVKAKLKEIFE